MLIKTGWNDETGLTGLEGAVILIAFVIVASVFSFTILGSGFFATGTAQDVVYSGVDQSASSLMLKGDVYGYRASDRDAVDMIRFTVRPSVAGGKPMDLSGSTLTYVTPDAIIPLQASDPLVSELPPLPGRWSVCDVSNLGDGDAPVIQGWESVTILVRVPETDAALPGERFMITLAPPAGTAMTVSRTVPSRITDVVILV